MFPSRHLGWKDATLRDGLSGSQDLFSIAERGNAEGGNWLMNTEIQILNPLLIPDYFYRGYQPQKKAWGRDACLFSAKQLSISLALSLGVSTRFSTQLYSNNLIEN